MTPVQLPEVPEPDIEVDGVFGHSDDKLRAYATEAVMAERRRVLAMAEKWRADVRDKYGFGPTGHATLAHAGELEALLNPSETNSER